MNKKAFLFLLPLLTLQFVNAQSLLIPAFKSPQNQYDYLVVTPQKFLTGAQNLAQFRQSFSGYKAGVVLLDTLYAQFDSAERKPYEKIWWSLKYAIGSWSVAPKMVVLIGSDSLAYDHADSTWHNYGDMPAVVYGNYSPSNYSGDKFQPECSDDYYALLKDSIPADFQQYQSDSGYAVAIGRIPCDSAAQCERYVQKVIDFENKKRLHKSWFNSAMVVSDDTMEGLIQDPLHFTHLNMAEECANTLLRSWFVTKIVGCAYAPDSLNFKPAAEDSVVNSINHGNLWSIYIGHGAPGLWSDERMLSSGDIIRFHNDTTPSVFVAFACTNAFYIATNTKAMCKQFLFSPHGGALAYIGATTVDYADANDDLMRAFFSTFNANQQMPLGHLLVAAKTATLSQNNLAYAFLGDPALSLSNGRINMSMTRNNRNQVSFACQSNAGGMATGNFDVRFYKRTIVSLGSASYIIDSLISRQTGPFANGSFSASLSDTSVRVVAFVWNGNGEGRMDSSFMVSALPIISQVKQHPGFPALRIESGKLILQAGSLRGTTLRLAAFTVDGRTVINKEIPVIASELAVDPQSMGLAAGTYFFRLSTIKGTFTQRMILSKK
jgi:Peptidase family C25